MPSLDLFNANASVEIIEALPVSTQAEKAAETTPPPIPPVYFGKTFEYCGIWQTGQMYYNDQYRVSFVKYGNCLLKCNKTHESTVSTKPVVQTDSNGNIVSVDNIFWDIVLTGEISDADTITALNSIQKVLSEHTEEISISTAAINTLGKNYNTLADKTDDLTLQVSTNVKNIKTLQDTVDANIAYPWVGTEDEYLALSDKDPNKFYYTYEE